MRKKQRKEEERKGDYLKKQKIKIKQKERKRKYKERKRKYKEQKGTKEKVCL